MMIVDILSPVGGRGGGIENAIKSWKRYLETDECRVRVIHMAPGTQYLSGFTDVYSFGECAESNFNAKLTRFAEEYIGFIKSYGAPSICVATNWPAMCVVAEATRSFLGANYKILSWVHNRIAEYEQAGLGGVNEMLKADGHLCISSNNERAVLAVDPAASTYLVANPIVMQEFVESVPAYDTLCYVGRLQDVKRVDVILEALYYAKYKWKLKIVGSGESEEELKEIVAYLHQENQVEFLGWKENAWQYVRGACALVTASEYEGFPLTYAEAMSMGLTVISTPVEGLIDYLKPGVNGYLFEKEDAKGLAQILDYIHEGKLPLCDRMTCRQSVVQYSEERYFDKLKAILKESLERKGIGLEQQAVKKPVR